MMKKCGQKVGGVMVLVMGLVLVAALAGCGPKAVRGGPGTDNPELNDKALSAKLDLADIEYLVSTNLKALSAAQGWAKVIAKAEQPPLVAIFPIQNNSTQHIDDQMDTLLSSIETYLVNNGGVRVVSREMQRKLINELQIRQSDLYDPQTAGRLGKQLGAQFFVTGKIMSVDERLKNTRRVQYSLFLQVIEVETGLVIFQKESTRSKAIKG